MSYLKLLLLQKEREWQRVYAHHHEVAMNGPVPKYLNDLFNRAFQDYKIAAQMYNRFHSS